MHESTTQARAEKTEAVIRTRKRKRERLVFKIDKVKVVPKGCIKYLEPFSIKSARRQRKNCKNKANANGTNKFKESGVGGYSAFNKIYGATVWKSALTIRCR